jgi:methylenetetrahydrofolate reductase (NADPH)
VPGILPVTNLKTLLKFSALCGASVPDWVIQRFAGLDEDPGVRPLVAAGIAVEICRALEREGVREFHFYTLNRAELTTAICRVLGVAERRPA